MFKYDERIDSWSKQMIAGYEQVWGNQIGKSQDRLSLDLSQRLITFLDSYIAQYGNEILTRFNALTALDYKLEDIGWYVNSIPVSLHSTGNRFVSISSSHQFSAYPTVLIHEISHIYFCNFLRRNAFLKLGGVSSLENIISPAQENELKEIATVIVNEEFSDLIWQPDEGYPNHAAIREKAANMWRDSHRDFGSWVLGVIGEFKKGQ